MELEKVILSNFRNYERQEITFSSNLNCIQGNNAEGKSNLLEAIYLISTGKSFRTHSLSNLIKESEKEFQIEAFFSKEGISNLLDISYGPKGRKVLYNQTSYSSFLPLLGILPCVLLAPEDISIITGAPAERRRFLDLHISQMDPQYVHHLGRYHKAMKQRNELLKKQDEKGLYPWEQIMAFSAHYLIEKREKALLNLKEPIENTISILSDRKEAFSWKYDNTLKVSDPALILEQWQQNRKKDLLYKSTILGPHRDNLLLYIQGQEIKTYCSEGQKRSCMAALRLAQWYVYKSFFEFAPLFAIDDFGVHLDLKRSLFLKGILKDLAQVFITAPAFPSQENSYTLEVSKGSIRHSQLN